MTNFDIYIVNHTKSIIMKHLKIRYLKQIIKKYINEEWIVQNCTLSHINQYKPLQNTN